MTATTSQAPWEADLAGLLERLSAAQHELLALLATKRQLIVGRNHVALAALADRENRLSDELRACHAERERLLERAEVEGLPRHSLADLSAALPQGAGRRLAPSLTEARRRAQLIRHECLAQWVATQRTVLHLAQMLEIIATGGRGQPTYGQGATAECSGSLMDQAA